MVAIATYEINDYLLNGTPVGALLGYTGTGLKPIFPIQPTPEANEINPEFPFLTYSVRTITDPEMWWTSIDEVTYIISSNDFEDIIEVAKEMIDIFKRLDESASDLQKYLWLNGKYDFNFNYIRMVSSMFPDPAPEEGGRFKMPVTIRYSYTENSGRGIS